MVITRKKGCERFAGCDGEGPKPTDIGEPRAPVTWRWALSTYIGYECTTRKRALWLTKKQASIRFAIPDLDRG